MNVKENSKQNLEKKPLENISQLIDKDRNFVKKTWENKSTKYSLCKYSFFDQQSSLSRFPVLKLCVYKSIHSSGTEHWWNCVEYNAALEHLFALWYLSE